MNATSVPAVDVTEVGAQVAAGAFLLDVREIDEWLAGHVAGATHIPLMDVPGALASLPTDRRVLCMCRSGNRSGQATAFLRQRGIDAANITGGMKAWAAAGLPVQRLDGSPGSVI